MNAEVLRWSDLPSRGTDFLSIFQVIQSTTIGSPMTTGRKHDLPAPAPSHQSGLLRLPREARRLAEPWRSLSGEIPGLTPALEAEFRFGQAVIQFSHDKYRIGGSIKGGGSALWTPSTAEQHAVYQAWKQAEGFLDAADPVARQELVGFLSSAGVKLVEPGNKTRRRVRQQRRGPIYRLTLNILRSLPFDHIADDRFQRLSLGGDGPDSAKCSAYDDNEVIMYDFALRGARRTFIGLLLHELGHPFTMRFSDRELHTLRVYHDLIVRNNALIGIEFLLSANARITHQTYPVEEFLAEFYMQYTACGSRVRRHIVAIRDANVRTAWRAIYDTYQRGFNGREYA